MERDDIFPIIEKLGGIEAEMELRQTLGITPEAIHQWYKRDSIPGPAMRLMMEIAEQRKIRYRAADFRLQRIGE